MLFNKFLCSFFRSDSYTRNNKPTPIAITDFFSNEVNSQKIGKNISQLISDNLERSGLFLPIDKKAFIQDISSLAIQPRFEDWKVIKVSTLNSRKSFTNLMIKLLLSLDCMMFLLKNNY